MNKAEKSRKYLFFSLILFYSAFTSFYIIELSIGERAFILNWLYSILHMPMIISSLNSRGCARILTCWLIITGVQVRKESWMEIWRNIMKVSWLIVTTRLDANYEGISGLIERIISTEYPDALKQLVLMNCDPLTLAIFLIALIPSKNLIPAQSALLLHSRVKTEPLMRNS